MSKPSIPKGTRDFLPEQSLKRQYIFDIIKGVFNTYGFAPIETPSFENLGTLMGKYGEEGDKLIFKIVNSGDFIKKSDKSAFEAEDSKKFGVSISEKALRYDLTVPFARFVVQNRSELSFPFKRYQIQPVWRADKPQRGRYREFYQCDVDIIGSESLLNEVELVQIINDVFGKLNVPGVVIKLNNRKILAGLAEYVEAPDKIIDITVALDKIDKIGAEKVEEEMAKKGVCQSAIDKLRPLLNFDGANAEKLEFLAKMLSGVEVGEKGIEEMRFMLNACETLGVDNLEIDLTLARGLNYYTGAIFEVQTKDFPSSITGGGRYDDLTGIFGLKDMSGVGVSFGADRIYDLMDDLDLFPKNLVAGPRVLFINFGEAEAMYCLKTMTELRAAGIGASLYPDAVKMKRQMKYADSSGAEFVVLAGDQEMDAGVFTVKNMLTGDQQTVNKAELVTFVLK